MADLPELARLPESLRKVGSSIAGTARTTTRAIATIRDRKDDDTGEESAAELAPQRQLDR